ncbi:MAG: dTMP kinase [Promethearchaeota archaeon]|nr:MAG: dTMP kinase [Candidatus Lokiarchaeota archaeon]
MTQKPMFIVLDGIDGSGTTTHCNLLKGFLETREIKVHLTQEPSNSEIGHLVRKFLKNKAIPPITDALLFAADRSLHFYDEINKKLEEGYIVISDRYIESSIIYQSLQSELVSIKWLKTINKFVGLPDLTIILDIDPKIALARKTQQVLEKFEDMPFLDKVRALYLKRAKLEKYAVVNSDDIIEFVQDKIQQIVLQKLKE